MIPAKRLSSLGDISLGCAIGSLVYGHLAVGLVMTAIAAGLLIAGTRTNTKAAS